MSIHAPEKEYLTNNPDVHAAVADGRLISGFAHFLRHGALEGRAYSHCWDFGNALDNVFGVSSVTPLPREGAKIISDFVTDCLIPSAESKILELLRLLGLADALKGSELPSRHEENIAILSVGCGAGKHEAALAGRFPNWSIVATDLEMPSIGTMASSNLEFRVSNILDWDESRDFDFVYSIECLEHIKDHALAFKHIANKVRPGGWLYLSVPFANRDEQMDEQLCKSEWENHQHYLPGFSDADLITLCRANGMEPVKITAIFNHEPRGTLTQLLGSMQRDYSSALPHIIALLALDVQWGHIPKNRNQSVGIRILAKKC